MLNTVFLRSFCTLVEVGHFTQTAACLHMTQSGVSQHIKKLEQQLGVDLLDRQGKQFTVTDAGQRLYKEAREIISSLSHLEQLVVSDPADEGLVRLMSPGSVGLKLYEHLIQKQQQHPKLIIDYRFAPNPDVAAALTEDRIDIGLCTHMSLAEAVTYEEIGQEPLLLVTPADVPNPQWQTLQKLGFIDHPDGSHHAQLLLKANFPEFQHSNQFKTHGFSNQISMILMPVSLGLGFTVLPAHAVANFAQPELICAHALQHPISETWFLGLRRNKPVANRINTIISEVKKQLQGHLVG